MTKQEVFNTVWRHFVVEGNPLSFDPKNYRCLYRGPDGAKCAIGLFLSDGAAAACNFAGVSSIPPHLFPKALLGVEMEFLKDLQQAHDSPCTTFGRSTTIKTELKVLAFSWDLQVSEKGE